MIEEARITERVAKWIRFELNEAKEKTCVWAVYTKDGGYLGAIKWWSGWRKYCYFPSGGSLYEQDCLRDIADFCQEVTTIHRTGPIKPVYSEVDCPF